MGNTTAKAPSPPEGPDEEFHDDPVEFFTRGHDFVEFAQASDNMGQYRRSEFEMEFAQASDNLGQYRPNDDLLEYLHVPQARDDLGQFRSNYEDLSNYEDIIDIPQASDDLGIYRPTDNPEEELAKPSDNFGQYRPSNDDIIAEFVPQASDNMEQHRPNDFPVPFLAQASDNVGQYRPSSNVPFVAQANDNIGRFRLTQEPDIQSEEEIATVESDSESSQKEKPSVASSFFSCCSGKKREVEKNTTTSSNESRMKKENSSDLSAGGNKLSTDQEDMIDHSQMTEDELGQLGVSVYCLENVFMPAVRKAGLDENSKIYEIENLHSDTPGVIRDKSKDFVCPITEQLGAAYVHIHKHKDLVGLATIMLSYAWGYTIGDIIDTLLLHCISHNLDPKKTYVWICCLCVNQHRVVESMRLGHDIPFDIFQRAFFKRVTSIGHILAMMAPWQAPYYLKRAWCVFEMFTASQYGCKITIEMPSSERNSFLEEITSGGIDDHVNKLFKTLASTSVANAEASVKSDLNKILKLIEEGKGYKEFDMVINGLIREWVIQIILDAVESKRQALVGGQCDNEHAFFLNQVGTLFANIGEYETAASMFQPVLEYYDQVVGPDHEETSSILNNMALVFEQQGKFEMALNYYNRVLAIDEEHKGKDHVDTALTLTNMAGVLWRQRKYEEALKILNRSISIQVRELGDHINTANTLNTMAIIYNRQSHYEKALETYERVLAMKEKLLGKEHTSTANTINNVGLVLKNQAKYDDALSHYHRALGIYEKVLGKEHPNTVRTQQNIKVVESLI